MSDVPVLPIVFLFGAIIGSFLNVVILRLRTGVGIQGRSMCMSCGKNLQWHELVPIASFVLQGGRCTRCKTRISWQYPAVEIITGILFVLVIRQLIQVGLTWPHAITAFIYLIIVSLLIVITVYDLRHKIIPDGLVYAFGALSFMLALLHGPHLWTLLAGPLLALPFALLWLVSKGRWIGLGDAKLVLGIGWLLGMNGGVNALVLAFWIGAVASILWLLITTGGIKRKAEIPFGPFLVLGTLLVLFIGPALTVLDVRMLASMLK